MENNEATCDNTATMGWIIGGVMAVIILILLVVVTVVFCRKRKENQRDSHLQEKLLDNADDIN